MDPVIIATIATGATCSLGAVIGTRVYLPKLIVKREQRKMTEAERVEYAVKAELLGNAEVVELLAPASEHQIPVERDGDKAKKPRQQSAWLSPYPEAVKAANKRRKSEVKKGAYITQTRKQIAAAASKVSVEVMPEGLQPANAGADHFFITFKLQGTTEQKLKGLIPQITSQLGLHSLLQVDAPDYRSIRFEAHTAEPVDRLTIEKIAADFFDENPATNPSLIPLARTAFGEVWSLPLHHTIILGMTGSGKGSPLAGIVRQLAPFVVKGEAKLYGADPKASELKPYEHSDLFVDLAYDDPDMAAMIETVHDIMKHRAKNKRLDLENADLGRSLEYTTETPLIVLMIDEFLSLLIQLQDMGKEGKRAITLLTAILAQGRSLGVLVVAATQEADKELLGRMRGNFANAIVLKQPSEYFNDLFLGQGAAAAGFDSTKIAPANKANNYATAGIGFVKEATGNPVRVRFAYSSDRAIADLIKAHARGTIMPTAERAAVAVSPEECIFDSGAPLAVAVEDTDDWGFNEANDDDIEGFESEALPKL